MDDLLGRIASQTVTFAIRSGIGVASSFAISQCSRYMKSIKGSDRTEFMALQGRLETKIKIISPAIDLVELIAARGNTSLDHAVALTSALRKDIQALGVKLQNAANIEERVKSKKRGAHDQEEFKGIMKEIQEMLKRIEDAVPLISLAVTTSGVNLSAQMPKSVSPSRLLQASMLLSMSDMRYEQDPFSSSQIGMDFTLTMYQLFAGHAHRTVEDLTWQEVASKCRVKLLRVPLHYGIPNEDIGAGDYVEYETAHGTQRYMRGAEKKDEYAYELRIIEDLDDGRIHEEETEPYDGVQHAGRRLSIPVHEISKIFYTNSGKLLGIDAASPVLLLKRNAGAPPPRRIMDRLHQYEIEVSDDEEEQYEEQEEEEEEFDPVSAQLLSEAGDYGSISIHDPKAFKFPEHLDKEWLAFEVWTEPIDDDDDDDDESNTASASASERSTPAPPPSSSHGISSIIPGMANLLRRNPGSTLSSPQQPLPPPSVTATSPQMPSSPPDPNLQVTTVNPSQSLNFFSRHFNLKSTLSLLECLLRLTGLQNFQQTSHLNVHDELLNLFLSDSYGDTKGQGRRERIGERRKIGFDPYGTPANPRRVGRMNAEGDTEYDDYDEYDEEDYEYDAEEESKYYLNSLNMGLGSPPVQQGSPSPSGRDDTSPGIVRAGRNGNIRLSMGSSGGGGARRRSSGVGSTAPSSSPLSGPAFTSPDGRRTHGRPGSSGSRRSMGTKGTSPFISPGQQQRMQMQGHGMMSPSPSKLRQEVRDSSSPAQAQSEDAP